MNSLSSVGGWASSEMELLCACLRPANAGASAAVLRCGPAIDWPRFVALAANHHVIPMVCATMKAAARDGAGVPPEWWAQLRSRRTAIAAYNLRALATAQRLQRELEAEGVALIPIKGPALALLAHGDLLARQFEDLDFIVRRGDLLRTVEWLERDGYRLRELSLRVSRSRYRDSLQNWSFAKSGQAPLDLKPVLISHALCGADSADFMAEACRWLPIDARNRLLVPGPEAMLLAVCLDGINEMWIKLSSVADVAALLAKHADRDWGGFLEIAGRRGLRRALLIGAGVAEELLELEPPAAFREAVRRDPAARRLAREAAGRLRTEAPRHAVVVRQAGYALRSRERILDRLRFVVRLLFVPGAGDLDRWRLPDALLPLLALARPFRLAWGVLVRGSRDRRLTLLPEGEKLSAKATD